MSTTKPASHRLDGRSHYLLRETDLLRIENLIDALNLAVSEIFSCRKLQDPDTEEEEEMPATESFTAQVDLVLKEAELQKRFPGRGASDF